MPACGDVNGVFPFTHVAGCEGGIALANAVLRLPRKADYAKVPWCAYTDPEVASVGLNEKRAQKGGVEYRVLTEPFAANDRALAEGEPLGRIKVLLSPSGSLLGCQIIGAHAGELIHEWIAAVAGGVKLSALAGASHVYPTLAEISKKVAGAYYSEKLFERAHEERAALPLPTQRAGLPAGLRHPHRGRSAQERGHEPAWTRTMIRKIWRSSLRSGKKHPGWRRSSSTTTPPSSPKAS